jgi:hypothetical protein
MRRCAKPKESYALAMFDARDAEAAESDDAGA